MTGRPACGADPAACRRPATVTGAGSGALVTVATPPSGRSRRGHRHGRSRGDLQQIPLGQLASQLGTDEQTAGVAASQAIPALLSGLHANAQDQAGAASLEGALGHHSAGLIDGGVDLAQGSAAGSSRPPRATR